MKTYHQLLVVPAATLALTLSACQESAPTAAPPTPVSPSTESQAAPTTQAGPTTQAEPTTQAPPTTDSAPNTSGGSGSGGCQSTALFQFRKGGAQNKPLTGPQTVSTKAGAQVQITIGEPTIDTSGGTSFFPGEGNQTVIYPVTVKVLSGSYFTSTYLKFGLVDGSGNPCKPDISANVVPRSDRFEVESLKEGDSLSKKIAFAMPTGGDLSSYSVLFADDYSGGQADLAWTAK